MSATAETATIAWGYTLGDLDRCVYSALRATWYPGADREEDRDAAWFAAVELLYAATERPAWEALLSVACNAVRTARATRRRHHGIGDDLEPTPNFRKFWGFAGHGNRTADDFTDHLVERLALPQVLALLTDREYQIVTAVAALGSQAAAATALGIGRPAVNKTLRRARERILAAWFEHETPHAWTGRGDDQVCRYGHDRATHSYRSARGDWICTICRLTHERRRRRRQAATAA